MFDMLILSGDTGDQSRKLSNRAEIWTCFWPSQIVWGGLSKNCTHINTPAWRHVVWRYFV